MFTSHIVRMPGVLHTISACDAQCLKCMVSVTMSQAKDLTVFSTPPDSYHFWNESEFSYNGAGLIKGAMCCRLQKSRLSP